MRFRAFWALVAIAAFAYCTWRVAGFVAQYSPGEIAAWFAAVPARHIVMAVVLTAASYATLTGFDYLGVRYAGHRLPYASVALASFVSVAVGYSLGPAPFGTGALRYFYYSRLGLGLEAFAKLVLLIMVTAMLAKLSFAGLVLLYDPSFAARWFAIDARVVQAVAAAALACVGLYVLLCATWRGAVRLWGWRFALPGAGMASAQVALGTVDYFCMAGALYWLMSATTPIPFAAVASAYVFANFAVLLSHVPGGWGVLEFVVLSLLPQLDTLGAVIAFRAVYYLVPLAIGLVVLVVTEGRRSLAAIRRPGRSR